MGEADEPKKTALAQASEDAMVIDTVGGRMQVRWDETAQATPHGQIVFLAEFWPRLVCSTAGCRAALCATAAPTHRDRATCWAR